jgi:hypothetical protein
MIFIYFLKNYCCNGSADVIGPVACVMYNSDGPAPPVATVRPQQRRDSSRGPFGCCYSGLRSATTVLYRSRVSAY